MNKGWKVEVRAPRVDREELAWLQDRILNPLCIIRLEAALLPGPSEEAVVNAIERITRVVNGMPRRDK